MINYVVNETLSDSLVLTITDLLNTQSFQMKVSGSKGAHRILWNREWEVEPYTEDEAVELNELLEAMVSAAANSRQVRQGYHRFKQATDPYQQRKILEPLSRGYLSYNLDPKFLIQKAGAGNFKMTLSNGQDTAQGILTIREDPME